MKSAWAPPVEARDVISRCVTDLPDDAPIELLSEQIIENLSEAGYSIVRKDTIAAVGYQAWALLDSWMANDPTHKGIADDRERVLAVCRTYGQYLKPEWLEMRGRLGQPVNEL